MSRQAARFPLLALLALCVAWGSLTAAASGEGLKDDAGAEWRVEQPAPPEPPPGVEGAKVPIGLGRIGDIEFWAPNRGALITAGNGSTVPPGVWLYNGAGWHELSTECGASDRAGRNPAHVAHGRIAWAGPDEFWTISDGRPGQAAEALGNAPELEDNTLCRFALNGSTGKLEIATSYASLAFQSSSYQPMAAAACVSPSDCWFAGELLPAPQVGTFQLHWNGHTLAPEPYLPEGHKVGDMALFEGRLYEGLRLEPGDLKTKKEGQVGELPALRVINPEGASSPFEVVEELPLLAAGEFPEALDFLHLSAAEGALWAAAGAARETPKDSTSAGVTVLRYSPTSLPNWAQVLGPETAPTGEAVFPGDAVNALAAEPATDSAWIALDSQEDVSEPSPTAPARVARVSADGTISDQLALPVEGEPTGPKGAAERLVCPAVHDCWIATTQGWLLHLSTSEERQHPDVNGEPAFAGTYLITERPADEGVPQQTPDTLPIDDSGLEETQPPLEGAVLKPVLASPFATVTLPLLSNLHTRVVHHSTLVLSFHLSVKAKIRLIAKRRATTVASTPTRTLSAGNRSLSLRLNVHRWPTKLALQTHALEPLKTTSTRESNSSTNSVSTSLAFPGTRALVQSSPFGQGPLP